MEEYCKITLQDTARIMDSGDYKDRMIAEYCQTKIRYDRLKDFCNTIEAAQIVGERAPEHFCPLGLLRKQQHAMGEYLRILELRAKIEHVCLPIDYIKVRN